MCGIAGFIDFMNMSTREILVDMTDALFHRGPDGSGYDFIDESGFQIGFGHRRLSIIDLSEGGKQPMWTQDGRWGITFNGEIYNFNEIKKELELDGYLFNSSSDTEVILQSFTKWGIKAVNKFVGMFAFVLYNKLESKIYIVRDRVGVKPLFYYFDNDLFLFSSELKSFHKHPGFKKEINIDSIAQFLNYGYILHPNCIFEYSYKLSPGCYLELDLKNKKLSQNKYWDVVDFYNKPKININAEDASIELEAILKSSFNYRMVSDVPVGVFLSGGYDSSAVAAILQSESAHKLKTFTIGVNDKKFNEAEYAKEIASIIGSEHTEYYCTEKEAKEIIPELPFYFDEPFFDYSAIPTVLVSRMARKDVTVALSADGGDEIFAGYSKFMNFVNPPSFEYGMAKELLFPITGVLNTFLGKTIAKKNYTLYNNLRKLKVMKDNSSFKNDPSFLLSTFNMGQFQFFETTLMLKKNHKFLVSSADDSVFLNNNSDFLSKAQAIDYKTYLTDDILVKVDRATMSVGLEGREPFLDHRIVEYTAQLPSSLKIEGKMQKYLLKKIVHKYLPEEMMNRPKMGFSIPLADWLSNDLKFYLDKYLDYARLKKQGLFEPEVVLSYKNAFLSGNKGIYSKIWVLLVFQMWHERWME